MRTIFNRRHRGDRGSGLLETMAGLALATIIVGGGAVAYHKSTESAAYTAAIEEQNSDISQTLDRLSQNIKVSNPILVAGPDELVIQSSEDDTTTIATRWSRSTNDFYRQVWTGQTVAYPYGSGAWIPATMATGTAPNGSGQQNSMKVVDRLAVESPAVPVFRYFDEAGAEIIVPAAGITAQNGDTSKIRRVDVLVTAETAKGGVVQNRTSASPRNTSGVLNATGDVLAPVCPAVTLQTSGGRPDVRWSTVTGSTTYLIYRNNALANTVTTAPAATQGAWVDTTAVINGDDAIIYKVLAQDGAGNVSPTSCRPQTWRAQIAAPAFTGVQVKPNAAVATDWTAGPDAALALKKPRITAAWNAVSGASSYTLLIREYDSSLQPIEPSFRSAAVLNASTLSFTWPEAGWGKYYGWKIRAESRSGQSVDSPVTFTLTHLGAPANVKVTPSYGAGADRLINGYNTITWDAVPGASLYDVFRYNSGTSGAVTLIGSVTPPTTSFTNTVPYGSTYSYYVAARNNGHRGTDGIKSQSGPNPEAGAQASTETMPTVSYTGGGSGGTASMAVAGAIAPLAVPATTPPDSPSPVVATQLMYPPVPTVKPVSAAAGTQTRDFDGSNTVVWDPAASATGYLAAKFTPGTSSRTCLIGNCDGASGGTTTTQLTDPAAKGTQWEYAVLAYNQTGRSVEFSAKVRLTQRPPAPALTITRAPSLSTSTADFRISQNADTGNIGTDKFCTSTSCSYELLRNGAALISSSHTQSDQNMDWTNAPNPEGATLQYSARSKNSAVTNSGWSDPSASQTVLTYPGDFGYNQWIGDANGNQRERVVVNKWNMDNAGASSWIQAGHTTVAWSSSAGASYVRWTRRAASGEVTSTDPSYVLPGGPNASATGNPAGGYQVDWAAPGAVYYFELTAVAPNGLQRPKTTAQFGTPAELPHHALMQIVCSGNTTSPWYADNNAHYIGGRMIDFWPAVVFGNKQNVRVHGLHLPKGQGWYNITNSVDVPSYAWDSSGWWGSITSGSGYGYYYGISEGFEVFTLGSVGPHSARLWFTIEALATFNSGCGPQWGTWGQLQEPTNPCYGYVPGQPCQTPNYGNRPQWKAKS